MKRYMILKLADMGTFCAADPDGGKPRDRRPFFDVTCEGGYTGPICATHLAALIKHGNGETPEAPTRAAQPPVAARPAQVPEAALANGPREGRPT